MSLLASSRFGGGGGGGQSTELENQIMNTVKQDMEAVDKLGQWQLSCYRSGLGINVSMSPCPGPMMTEQKRDVVYISCFSPAKDCVSVPGMDDLSPEELRSATNVLEDWSLDCGHLDDLSSCR